jgi:Fe-S-cluster-containing dehydrogenase component/anaerobic selenocysteine-containing dehydrogenase
MADNNLTLRPKAQADETPPTLQELMQRDDFEAYLEANFPTQSAAMRQAGMDRRTFMKLMGASMALGGLTLAGCTPAAAPGEKIIPYVRQPEEILPGRPQFYASTATLSGYGTGVLIEAHEARPTRLEGNPDHPASLGGSNVIVQASILSMYDPERSTQVLRGGNPSNWDAVTQDLNATLGRADNSNGAGLRLLTGTISSPTLIDQINTLLERYPNAQWVQYDPINYDNVAAGAQLAFGENVNTVYDFTAADVVLSLDADFLNTMPGNVRYARDWAERRKVRVDNADASSSASMSRTYAVESTPSVTGSNADHRLALRSSDVQAFARALAAELGVEGVEEPLSASWDEAFLRVLTDELQEAGANALVVVGPEQPAAVHALAHAINAQLGAVGTTVRYTEAVLTGGDVAQNAAFAQLVSDMQAGQIDSLLIFGGNPVYNAPADLDFAGALANVQFSAHLSLFVDETSQATLWHLPSTHFVEEWGDTRAYDGTVSLTQPPTRPLYENVRAPLQIMALLNQSDQTPFEMLQSYWQANASGDMSFEGFWRQALHDGVVPNSAAASVEPSLTGSFASDVNDIDDNTNNSTELVFRVNPSLWDGGYSQNAWLQELPHPITKVAWDNHAMMNPAQAERLGVNDGDIVELSYGGNTMRIAALSVQGHADNSVTVLLGYGTGISADLEAGQNFNAYQLRTSAAPWFATGLEVRGTNQTYPLAIVRTPTQEYPRLHPVKSGSLATFQEDAFFVEKIGEKKPDGDLLRNTFEYDGFAWGMSIDLTSCIGCNACMIACQMENNIPTVGKREVLNGRDMSWIRIDRHYKEEDGELRTHFQPVACVHCENAPCEYVCPVQATVHDHEGLNLMVYNRCVGTRYCSANCPYGVRRFNYFGYATDAPLVAQEWRNPDVSVRPEGVMEKCTYCVQRIKEARIATSKERRPLIDGEVVVACQGACPTQAISFGDINDSDSVVARDKRQPHDYSLLGELNTKPRTTYLARLYNPNGALNASSAANEEA